MIEKMHKTIQHREYGRGPRLILMHGWGGTPKQWRFIIPSLMDRYCVTVLDLSQLFTSTNGLSFENMLHCVEEYCLKNFGHESLHVVGQCLGGGLGWALASRGRLKVERLDLLNPTIPCRVDDLLLPEARYFFVLIVQKTGIIRLLSMPIGQSLMKRAGTLFFQKSIKRIRATRFDRVASAIVHVSHLLRTEDWKEWEDGLKSMTVPITLVWSMDDILFKPEAYVRFAQDLQNVSVIKLDKGGHLISLACPDTVLKIIEGTTQSATSAAS